MAIRDLVKDDPNSGDSFHDLLAEVMFSGNITPESAPPGYEQAAAVIQAARASITTGELAVQDQCLAALLERISSRQDT
jgi:hypothetical protein